VAAVDVGREALQLANPITRRPSRASETPFLAPHARGRGLV